MQLNIKIVFYRQIVMCKMWICVLFLISFVTSPAVTRVTDNGIQLCGEDNTVSFRCPDGACLGPERICDGVDDCFDRSDEMACLFGTGPGIKSGDITWNRSKRQTKCRKNEWQCRDGTCISFDGKCDGAVDCPDRSDETHALCRQLPCQSNWFRCTYGACVDGTAPCNGHTECADNSDELLARCRNETLEVKGQFKCQDGTKIAASDHCDGVPNCPDGSDETVAVCGDKFCPSYLFQCAYGACVDQGADCNGIQECADGSDESEELCNRIGTPVVKPTPKPGACVLPPYPDHGTYEVSNVPNARPGQALENFVLTVSCQKGYGLMDPDGGRDGNGTQKVYCISGGLYQTIPRCVQFCKIEQDVSVTYTCQIPGTTAFQSCKSYVEPGTVVNPVCNSPNYYYPETLKYMKCIAGSWDYVAICKPGLVKNGTNITILFKDQIEIYIHNFMYASNNNNNNEKVTVNLEPSKDSSDNTINLNTNNGFSININNNANSNKLDTTVNPLDYEILEEDWRMGPIPDKTKRTDSIKVYKTKNSSLRIRENSSDNIKFKN